MTDFASRHNNTRRFLSSSPWHFSIAQTTVEITIFILAQKLTTTDKYWWSLGPAKFDAAMAEFEAKTRRAEAPSILVCFLHIMHINVANSIYYHRVTSRHCYNNIISFNTANNTEMDCTTEQIMFVCVGVWCGARVVGSFQRDLSYPIRGRRMKILLLLSHFDATKGPRGVIPSWL